MVNRCLIFHAETMLTRNSDGKKVSIEGSSTEFSPYRNFTDIVTSRLGADTGMRKGRRHNPKVRNISKQIKFISSSNKVLDIATMSELVPATQTANTANTHRGS